MAPLANDEDHKIYGEGCGSHFLVVAYSIQGHVNPARTLAHRLAQTSGCTATLSVPLSCHRRMFPSSSDDDGEATTIISDGLISYLPFSDGKDDGSWPVDSEDRARRRDANFRTLSAVVSRLASGGSRPPVTCVVCTLSMPMVREVARAHGLPLAVYWIQPATVLATYYHYFHGHDALLRLLGLDDGGGRGHGQHEVTLPGLHRPLRARDMPTFLSEEKSQDGLSKMVLQSLRELFQKMDQEQEENKPVVLVNTFGELEDVALRAVHPYMDVFAVGPAVPVPGVLGGSRHQGEMNSASELAQIHLVPHDDETKKAYMEWLDAQPEKSVVYLSFGSLLGYTKRQAEEVLHGLQASGRPYLWVVRKEGRAEEVDLWLTEVEEEKKDISKGMVVAWCDQQRVLAHPSVGCFVTHCGWNSTLEAVVCGVPMVAVPSWSDQPVNAWLVEEEWGVGVRAERDGEGVLTRGELARCVELLMGGGDRAVQVRANASGLKERARRAVAAAGPLEACLESFVETMQGLGRSGKQIAF
ncbi:UDP-glycosyltransferase 75B1 [Zea mays]|nr:UDP-glycosyltransferase 75B1 [Zea mays]